MVIYTLLDPLTTLFKKQVSFGVIKYLGPFNKKDFFFKEGAAHGSCVGSELAILVVLAPRSNQLN